MDQQRGAGRPFGASFDRSCGHRRTALLARRRRRVFRAWHAFSTAVRRASKSRRGWGMRNRHHVSGRRQLAVRQGRRRQTPHHPKRRHLLLFGCHGEQRRGGLPAVDAQCLSLCRRGGGRRVAVLQSAVQLRVLRVRRHFFHQFPNPDRGDSLDGQRRHVGRPNQRQRLPPRRGGGPH